MSIADNLKNIKSETPDNVTLVAVSKTHPAESVKEAYNAGQKIFGENKVQELVPKYESLKDLDIKWHLIGHLQTNKVKYIAQFIEMIHSVDSFKLLSEINKQAEKHNRVINCLLQFYIAKEETKFGLDLEEAETILESEEFKNLKNIRICGVMGMASFVDNESVLRKEFKNLKSIFSTLKNSYFASSPYFSEISMGMSSDWKIAIEEGSTMVRIGSSIFGIRNYNK